MLVTGRNEVVAKVMFLHVCVILFTGGVSGQESPPRQGELPLGADTPQSRHPPGQGEPSHHPREQTPPRADPRREAHSSIRSMRGRYASYWNAFLVFLNFCKILDESQIFTMQEHQSIPTNATISKNSDILT